MNRYRRALLRFSRGGALLLLVFTYACTKPDDIPDVCVGGQCEAQYILQYPLDNNGYYHVKLDYTQKHYPRFDIEVIATPTTPYWWYNDQPVVQANFETDTYWTFENDILPVVQYNRVYLTKVSDSKMYTKRVVGPIPPHLQGDTISISSTCFWDAGEFYKKKQHSFKIILE